MKLLNNLLTGFLKGRDDFNYEDKVVLLSSYYLCIITFFATFINIFLNLTIETIILVFVTFAIFLIGFITGRFYKKVLFAKWLLTIMFFIFCNVYWLTNYGSHGSAMYAFITYFCTMIIIWDRPKYIVMVVLLNILVLCLIEIKNPEIIARYASEITRIIDSYVTLFMITGLVAIILISAKNNYIKQYKLAQKSDELKSNFIKSMSHEIRTPLNAIVGFTSVLTKQDNTPERQQYYAGLIIENSSYLDRLASDIMDMSTIDSGLLKFSYGTADVSELYHNLYNRYMQIILESGKDIDLEMNIPATPVSIETDPARLEQISKNLLDNAVKYTLKGRIEFGFTVKHNKEILFYVSDTGVGIKEEFKPYIFRRFVSFRDQVAAEVEDHTARGAGISLSLTKDLVELLGGSIWYNSAYNRGSTFYFTLPLARVMVHT